MEELTRLFFKFLTLVFTIGWIGCLITIPLAAFKFFSVLFEQDAADQSQEFASKAPAKS
jgi:hypothetical protein